MPQSLLATTTHHEHLVRHTSGKRGSRRILQEAFQNDGSLTRMQGSLQSDTTDLANVQYTRHRLGGAMRSTRYHCVCSGLSHAYRQIDGAIQDRQHWHWRSGAYTLIITDSILLNGTIPVTMPGHTSVPAAAAAILQQMKQQQGKSYRCARKLAATCRQRRICISSRLQTSTQGIDTGRMSVIERETADTSRNLPRAVLDS